MPRQTLPSGPIWAHLKCDCGYRWPVPAEYDAASSRIEWPTLETGCPRCLRRKRKRRGRPRGTWTLEGIMPRYTDEEGKALE